MEFIKFKKGMKIRLLDNNLVGFRELKFKLVSTPITCPMCELGIPRHPYFLNKEDRQQSRERKILFDQLLKEMSHV